MNTSHRHGFSLVELLVVVAIIGVLVGLALPAMTRARQAAVKTACATNLNQIGHAVTAIRDRHQRVYPAPRYMPPPFVSSLDDPTLPELIADELPGGKKIFKCPGDGEVFELSGSSYYYNAPGLQMFNCLEFEGKGGESTQVDGFAIAEEDLRIRGPGDLTGEQQSGYLRFHAANLATDMEMMNDARARAFSLLESDSALAQPELREAAAALRTAREQGLHSPFAFGLHGGRSG